MDKKIELFTFSSLPNDTDLHCKYLQPFYKKSQMPFKNLISASTSSPMHNLATDQNGLKSFSYLFNQNSEISWQEMGLILVNKVL